MISKAVQARHAAVHTGSEELVGAHGVVRSPLDPVGHVFVQGALWRARTRTGRCEAGERGGRGGGRRLTLTVVARAPETAARVRDEAKG